MAGSTVSGIGSNIDTQAIVQALVNSQKAPKQAQINTQTLKATTTLSSIGKVQAALDAFRGALQTMTDSNTFSGLSVKSSDEKVATVKAGNGAANGTFSLVVENLATASKVSTQVYADGAGSVVNKTDATTTLSITQSGKTYDLKVTPGMTLQQVRDNINSQFGTVGLSANVLTDANGSRLVVTSTKMGEGSDITLGGSSGIDTGYTQITAPANAKYLLDGIAMSSKSNDISDAVSGLSITLTGATPETGTSKERSPIYLSLSTSAPTLKSGVQGFIDTYNALMTTINTETKVTKGADGNPVAGALTGDATMRGLVTSIRNELSQLSGQGAFKSLAQFGVTTSQDGGLLSLDDKKWSAAAATNIADLTSVFNGKDGLLARMKNATESFAKANTGTLAERTKTLTENLNKLTTEQSKLDERMTALQKTLQDKYNAMDTLVAQLRAQSNSVMTTLNALNKANSDD
ncbi:flagellar filament capping protein FliD [Pseudomonas cremoricolorata]|uniref:flagellar filament capping protein FliD n=1 Tax=Pseudomonas cremoricolorata TaxID=157783 RepID=UPI0003FF3D5A|nr:flagellar filament capping protein FliD [Pseudomonas cremoricolorata]